jgi:hypothetical protein
LHLLTCVHHCIALFNVVWNARPFLLIAWIGWSMKKPLCYCWIRFGNRLLFNSCWLSSTLVKFLSLSTLWSVHLRCICEELR